ncbi:hypothetical protein LIER_40004 [Lithospermum erythrorhizon]|uniref:Uncharacterized protein n=1 Tax=Lithospermum erythrorhizon TaxID=34254 RepID=A0AAV3QN96_LITER
MCTMYNITGSDTEKEKFQKTPKSKVVIESPSKFKKSDIKSANGKVVEFVSKVKNFDRKSPKGKVMEDTDPNLDNLDKLLNECDILKDRHSRKVEEKNADLNPVDERRCSNKDKKELRFETTPYRKVKISIPQISKQDKMLFEYAYDKDGKS